MPVKFNRDFDKQSGQKVAAGQTTQHLSQEGKLAKIRQPGKTLNETIDTIVSTLEDNLGKFHGSKTRQGYVDELKEKGTWAGADVGKAGIMGHYKTALEPLLKLVDQLYEATGFKHETISFNNTDATGDYDFDVKAADTKITEAYNAWEQSVFDNVPEAEMEIPRGDRVKKPGDLEGSFFLYDHADGQVNQFQLPRMPSSKTNNGMKP